MFVDYENLHSILTAQSSEHGHAHSYASEILDEVQRYLEEGDDTPTILERAYAPYDALRSQADANVPSSLFRSGIDPVYVPDALQDNPSEVRLTMDVTQMLTERPDIQTVVIVTGDRPYLPLVRSIGEQGCRALVAAVNPPPPSEASAFVENDLYLDARNLLSKASRQDLLANAPQNGRAQAESGGSPPPRRYRSLTNAMARRTIEITEQYFGQYEEVYLTPLLRKLSDVLGPDQDPKSLVSNLEAAGAVRLEKRNGYPYDYTVLIVNDDHPDVQDIHDSMDGSSFDEYEAEDRSASTDTSDNAAHDYDEYAMDEAVRSGDADTETDVVEDDEDAKADAPTGPVDPEAPREDASL
jgi:hypothetical protein